MHLLRFLPAGLLLWLSLAVSPYVRALDVLFVGNSFTYGYNDYNHAAISDANGGAQGGVPALFKKLADEGGHPGVEVTIEAVGGQTLAYHLGQKTATLDRAWDVVVLQEYSTRPLAAHPAGDVPAFRAAVRDIAALLRARNPAVRIFLYETWARPDQIPAAYPALASMQADLRAAYSAAAADHALEGWAPVGDAFLRAIADGVAYDPDSGAQAGKVDLWDHDNYHASAYGAYLAALVFHAKILGGDPRALPNGPGSAVAGLGLVPDVADALKIVAHSIVPSGGTAIVTQPVSVTAFPGEPARFEVNTSGATAFQWRRNGVALPGATTARLTIDNVAETHAGLYDVVVTGVSGELIQSAAAVLTVTTRWTSRTFLLDLGSSAPGFPTQSPDEKGRFWNQLTTATTTSRLSSPVDLAGDAHPELSAWVTAAFGGINTVGVDQSGIYPATAQRDSFFVTGTGTVAGPERGEITFAGLPAGARVTVRLFGSRAGSGARVGRYTLGALPPAYLDATDNTADTIELGPAGPDAEGRVPLVVEPYDSADIRQEYAYLGVVELTVVLPAPTPWENWTSAHGLGGVDAALTADPDADGQPNLLEFALGSHPADASSANTPMVLLTAQAGRDYLRLFTRKTPNPDADSTAGVSLKAEVSSDLVHWFSGPGHTVVLTDSPVALDVRDAASVFDFPRRFIRLRAEIH